MGDSDRPRVLFLCTGNSCRSQMAQGFLRQMAGDCFEALSAGMTPATSVHPLAVKAMAEVGIDISNQEPKTLKLYLGRAWIKWLIVVCDKANESCPRVWPMLADENRLYWPFDDPAEVEGSDGEKLAVFRRVRDEIKARLTAWLGTVED